MPKPYLQKMEKILQSFKVIDKLDGQWSCKCSPDMGMFKNNEAFHFMASFAHICLDFKDQT